MVVPLEAAWQVYLLDVYLLDNVWMAALGAMSVPYELGRVLGAEKVIEVA